MAIIHYCVFTRYFFSAKKIAHKLHLSLHILIFLLIINTVSVLIW